MKDSVKRNSLKQSIKITFYSRFKNKKIVTTNDITVITVKKTTQFLIVLIFFIFRSVQYSCISSEVISDGTAAGPVFF